MHKTVLVGATVASVAIIAFAVYLSQIGTSTGRPADLNCRMAAVEAAADTGTFGIAPSTQPGPEAECSDPNDTTGKPGEVKGQ